MPGGGKKQALVGALMRMMGALEARGGWCSQARHVRGGRDRLADGLTRWKIEQTTERQNVVCPLIAWQVLDLGDEGRQMYSEMLREGTPLRELQLRLERPTKRIGGCG